ncbi:MAG TPA: class I SAM-dependent methyltransferase [Ktedonobacterales bacterium]|nr:class I SAM-dependent methyltransferase [Ktedonobacterales bacterium]
MSAEPRGPASADSYADIAEWYDLEHDGFSDDIEMLNELLAGARERLAVLEVGAGSGRLLAALAAAGHTVVGVEPSAAMRARCAKRLAALPERVARRARIVEGKATALNLPDDERFDLALMGLGAFCHLTSAAERHTALRLLYERLKIGGMLLLDVDLSGPRRLLESAGRLWWQGSWRAGEDGALIVSHTITGAPGREMGTVEVTHLYDAHEQGGPLRRTLAVTSLALLARGEVELAVRHAGFTDITIYGGYDLSPADDQSPRAIVVAHLPHSRPL